ncbi:F0F1 ATP synthase subunit I [Paracoccus sediminis]|jgi:ATP synthase protein I|uniref:ATP synthase protein I n=1 Tax=Paracoccus sediminis TaxID=1214787 RepID=A0A238XIC5_9RHOB|nr:AtpZ/AtpI family protein [Paracoccus sediminis]TBN48524.1 F0F1 ATP synthase subunit I [Paracoccus sediminis]SNR58452.1 ATP synthase protein I [Paracoccus sediminis]
MAERPGDDGRDADAARLRALEDRLSGLTRKPEADMPMAGYDKAHVAWRMVTEIVAGILMGAGIGYGLDWLFGTLPVMLILFILIGFVAGIKVMMRTAAELGSTSGPAPGTDERD